MIFRLLSRPGAGSFGMAMALSVILAVLTAGIILWVDRFRAGDIGTF
jgi:thiamine transport system permease protein